MGTNMELGNPAQKRLEAENLRKGDNNVGNDHLARIVKAINDAPACANTTPVVVFGVRTSEYCIIPCPERDDTVIEIMQYLQGRGYFVSRFRKAKLDGKYTEFSHALLVVWDRRVLRKSVMPRYYTVREDKYSPCGNCYMHSRNPEGVKTCEGCDVLAMWLCGVNCLQGKHDPCIGCKRATESKGRPVCDTCPARTIWMKQNPDAAITPRGEQGLDPAIADTLVSAASKSAAAPSAQEGALEGDSQGTNDNGQTA